MQEPTPVLTLDEEDVIPFLDRVIAEPLDVSGKTTGGVFLPDSARETGRVRARVVRCGEGFFLPNGRIHPMPFAAGDVILFERASAAAIKVGLRDYLLVNGRDVIGKVVRRVPVAPPKTKKRKRPTPFVMPDDGPMRVGSRR